MPGKADVERPASKRKWFCVSTSGATLFHAVTKMC